MQAALASAGSIKKRLQPTQAMLAAGLVALIVLGVIISRRRGRIVEAAFRSSRG
jgi:LPXTG-motif cell wall-anchored protein